VPQATADDLDEGVTCRLPPGHLVPERLDQRHRRIKVRPTDRTQKPDQGGKHSHGRGRIGEQRHGAVSAREPLRHHARANGRGCEKQ
jgi:hypothetical protein